jgi:hypothetical protein
MKTALESAVRLGLGCLHRAYVSSLVSSRAPCIWCILIRAVKALIRALLLPPVWFALELPLHSNVAKCDIPLLHAFFRYQNSNIRGSALLRGLHFGLRDGWDCLAII